MSRLITPRLGLASAVALVLACAGPADSPSGPSPFRPNPARGGNGPSVSLAAPAYGYRGEIGKQVTISGSGFEVGATAAWELGGLADPNIQVLSTQFVSSTQLIATITIQADAAIELYDISVTNPGRKKGIGFALFEVTQAQQLAGASLIRAANEAGQFVGQGDFSFVWSPLGGMEPLPDGGPWGISEDGATIVGGTGISPASGDARIWTRVGGAWQAGGLPQDPAAASHNARGGVGSDPITGAAVVIGGVEGYKIKAKVYRKPRLWLPSGSGWARMVLPGAGATSDDVLNDVSPGLVAVGAVGTQAAIWEPASAGVWTLTTLGAGGILGINNAGTIAVGTAGGVSAYWRKVAGVWTGPTSLACIAPAQVDDFDRIYCDGAVMLPPAYTTSLRLGGFGDSNLANVEGISRNGTWIVGSASDKPVHGGYTGAYWRIF